GATLRAGGIGCVEHIRNPVQLARKVLEESAHVYLVAEGAELFAQQHGIDLCRNEELVIAREVERLHRFQEDLEGQNSEALFSASHDTDTVGALALDSNGNIDAATSTGGTLNKTPGRVGDSSVIGCGCYAANESAAVSTTGWGEPIMKLVLGKWAVDRVASGVPPQEAAQTALNYLKRRLNGHGGMILLDPAGRIGLWRTTPRMAWAWKSNDREESGIQC